MSLSLDTTTLVHFYGPFQPVNLQGWMDDGGNSAYFVSQGSEYRLDKPTHSSSNVTASGDVLKSLQSYLGPVTQTLSSSSDANCQRTSTALTDWLNAVTSGTSVEQMVVTTALDHIRNNQDDDNAQISLTYVYCPPLNTGLLVQTHVSIDWSSGADTIDKLINLYEAVDSVIEGPDGSFEDIALFLTGAELIDGITPMTAIAVALLAVDLVGNALINLANDGGRVNFIAVIAHAILRCSASTTPIPSAGSTSRKPVLDADALGAAWIYTTKSSTIDSASTNYLEGLYFGTYPGTQQMWNGNVVVFLPSQPFETGMPELSWSHQGLLTLATAKIHTKTGPDESPTEDVYTVFFLVFGPDGKLLMTSSATQGGASSQQMALASPVWMDGSLLGGSGSGVVGQELLALGLFMQSSVQMQYVVPAYMVAIRDALRVSAGDWMSPAQPTTAWAMSFTSTTSYDSGTHPAVVVRSDGKLVESHASVVANVSHLYANHGTVDGSGTVTWSSKNSGVKYDSGDWPGVAVEASSSGRVLEIHNGGSNNIYWEDATIKSDGSVSFSGDGTKICSGDHPSICLCPSGVFVELHTSGTSSLRYGIGTFSSGSVSMSATDKDYQDGDYGTVGVTGNTVVEVHNDHSKLWFNTGTIASDKKSIGWGGYVYPFTLDGTHPHLIICGDGRIVLTYDDDGSVYYALGKLTGDKVLWHVLNGKICSGEMPAIAYTPSGQFVMVLSRSGTLYSATGTLNTPQ